MKPCGESRNAPGKKRTGAARSRAGETVMNGKGRGDGVSTAAVRGIRSRTHTACAGQCAAFARAHTKCTRQCAASARAHTQSVPDSVRHTLVHERKPCTVSAPLAVYAASARIRIAVAMFSHNGKKLRMFYASRTNVSLHPPRKHRWHGTCLFPASVFAVRASGRNPVSFQSPPFRQTITDC